MHQSSWARSSTENQTFRFYDPKSKIRYNIENDSTHLFIRMDVIDTGTKLRILRTGTKLNFSPAGKKKTVAALEFPYVNGETPIEMDPTQHHQIPRNGSAYELSKLLPKEGVFYRGDSVNVSLVAGIESESFIVEMKVDPSGALIYNASIPLARVASLGRSFSLGFETGAFKIDNPEYERQMQATGAEGIDRSAGFSQNRMNPNSPMGTNQPYGNVYQPGMNNDQYRAAPPRLGVRSALSDPISFWIQVNLSDSPNP